MIRQTRQSGLGFAPIDDFIFDDYSFDWWDSSWGGNWWEGSDGGDDWWNNFDPVTGDWVDPSEYETLVNIETREPVALPSGQPNWWDVFNPESPPIIVDYRLPYYSDVPDWKATEPQAKLPGYCVPGTYHPISDPFKCVPFPADPVARKAAQRQAAQQQAAQQRAQQQPKCPPNQIFNSQLKRCVPKCPSGQVFVPPANRCLTPPRCQQGLRFNASTGRCEKATGLFDTVKGWPWWIWLLIAGGVVVATNQGESAPRRRRTR